MRVSQPVNASVCGIYGSATACNLLIEDAAEAATSLAHQGDRHSYEVKPDLSSTIVLRLLASDVSSVQQAVGAAVSGASITVQPTPLPPPPVPQTPTGAAPLSPPQAPAGAIPLSPPQAPAGAIPFPPPAAPAVAIQQPSLPPSSPGATGRRLQACNGPTADMEVTAQPALLQSCAPNVRCSNLPSVAAVVEAAENASAARCTEDNGVLVSVEVRAEFENVFPGCQPGDLACAAASNQLQTHTVPVAFGINVSLPGSLTAAFGSELQVAASPSDSADWVKGLLSSTTWKSSERNDVAFWRS
jgi:hypothetical protein